MQSRLATDTVGGILSRYWLMDRPLSEVFLAHLDGPARSALTETNGLEQRLVDCLANARARWPLLDVPNKVFLPFLAGKLIGCGLEDLHIADLYLACGCAQGNQAAIAALEKAYFGEIADAVRRVSSASDLSDEARQEVRIKLFLGAPGTQPRIGLYSGRGDLAAWLRVTGLRTALNIARKKRRESSLESQGAVLVPLTTKDIPETIQSKLELRTEFELAVRQAVQSLSKRDRSVLQLHYQDALTMDEIAAIFGVHRITILRWIASARRALLAHAHQTMYQRLKMDSTDLESAMRFVRSQLAITLRMFLDPE